MREKIVDEMKTYLSTFLVALLTLFYASCSSEDIVPSITVPNGAEDYFTREVDFDAPASERTISFATNMDWKISIPSNIDWCHVTPTEGSSGSQTVKISVSDNPTYDDRTAILRLSVGDSVRTIKVNQKQLDALTLTADKFEVAQSGGTIDVEVKSNIDFTYSIPEEFQSWIHASSVGGTRALTSHHLSFVVDASEEYNKREGQIVIKSSNKEELIHIYQVGGGLLTLSSNHIAVGSKGGTAEIVVNSNFDFGVDLPSVDWLKLDNSVTTRAGMSSHVVKLNVLENSSYDDRSAVVRIYDKNSGLEENVKLTQSRVNAIIVDGDKMYTFDEDGGNISIAINASVEYQVSTDCNWISESKNVAKTRALSKSNHLFVIHKLDYANERIGKIIFKSEATNTEETVTVVQRRNLYFSSSDVKLLEGTSQQLQLINYLENKSVVYSSSNEAVATINQNGTLTAISRGNTVITAKSADGKYVATCNVLVEDITDKVECTVGNGGFVANFNGVIQNGSTLGISFRNRSENSLYLKEIDFVDGKNGMTYVLSINRNVQGKGDCYYTFEVGFMGLHLPTTCRCKIEYNGKSYIKEFIVSDI